MDQGFPPGGHPKWIIDGKRILTPKGCSSSCNCQSNQQERDAREREQ